MTPKQCPSCAVSWECEETIYEHFLAIQGNDEVESRRKAEMYGCTPDNPKHFGVNVVGIEVQGQYDGISYWKCLKCEATFNRWDLKPVDKQLGCKEGQFICVDEGLDKLKCDGYNRLASVVI